MTEVRIPQNVTVWIEDEEGNELASSLDLDAGEWLKFKSTLNPCYIKVTSGVAGHYVLTVNAYTEK